MGALMAAVYSAIAILVLVIALVGGLTGAFGDPANELRDLVLGIGATIIGYFAAGFIGGIAVWILQPLRRFVVGWILTGIAVATNAYGGIGLLGVLAYVWLGVNMFDFESAADAWRSLPIVTIGLGLFAGIPGGLYFWWKRPWG